MFVSSQPRYEVKFILAHDKVEVMKQTFVKRGFHRRFDNRIVNSVYLDDIYFKSAFDNLSGITPRKKIRFRWYGPKAINVNNVLVEHKIKNGSLGIKNIFKRTSGSSEGNKICSFGDLREYFDRMSLPLTHEPKIYCSYEREYFENHDGLRVTFDRNLRFSEVKTLKLCNISDVNINSSSFICEIKFQPNLERNMSKIIRDVGAPSVRCSKYLIGLSKLRGFKYT